MIGSQLLASTPVTIASLTATLRAAGIATGVMRNHPHTLKDSLVGTLLCPSQEDLKVYYTHTHTHTHTLIHHILSSPSDQKFSKHSAFADNPQSYSSFSTKDPSPSSPSYTSYTSSTSSSSRGGNSTSSGAAGKFPYTGTGRVWHVSACIHSH